MLEAHALRKTYGGVVALAGADFTVRAGTVHALLGENGAGKSTLVKIVAGAIAPDRATLRLDGRPVRFATTAEAVRHGVAVVSQELNLFPDLDVLANLFTMREIRRGPFIARAAMAARARPVLRSSASSAAADPVEELTARAAAAGRDREGDAHRPARADPRRADLGTRRSRARRSSSTPSACCATAQVGVVFVTHILEEVMALCDEVTVLRDGRGRAERGAAPGLTVPAIVDAMLGAARAATGARRPTRSCARRSRSRSTPRTRRAPRVARGGRRRCARAAHADVERGEVVGLAGVAGAGHHAVLELVSGLRRADGGEVVLPNGRPVPAGLRRAVRAASRS